MYVRMNTCVRTGYALPICIYACIHVDHTFVAESGYPTLYSVCGSNFVIVTVLR